MEYMIGTILSHIPNIILFDFHIFVKKSSRLYLLKYCSPDKNKDK